jgi:putative alpha-1,2-mannosidase
MNKLYSDKPDGLCGDEDNGQTSAWYVFSAMGFYPVCPGTQEYVLGSPLFEKITLNLDNNNRFIIEAKNNTASNVYIKRARLNMIPYNRNFLNHETIRKGGKLVLEMTDSPSLKRGTAPKSRPYSISKRD